MTIQTIHHPSPAKQSSISQAWAMGRDSYEIARFLNLRECTVARVLAEQQNARRALREREARQA